VATTTREQRVAGVRLIEHLYRRKQLSVLLATMTAGRSYLAARLHLKIGRPDTRSLSDL